MTDVDRMAQLQAAASILDALTTPVPEGRPPLAEQTENVRALRTIVAAVGALLALAVGHAAAERSNSGELMTRVKNPQEAANQLAAAQLSLTDASDKLFHVAGVLTMSELALSRLEQAPPDPEATDD